jgi:hypothetical protein
VKVASVSAIVVFSVAGSFIAGWMLRPSTNLPAAPVQAPSQPVAAPFQPRFSTISPADRDELLTEVRAVVRDELAKRPSEEKSSAEPEKSQLPSADQVQAGEHAHTIIDRALSSKRWTEEDREQFREQTRDLTDQQKMELYRSILPAVNRQEIKVEVHGPLF